MAGSSKDVRAGKAYIELTTKGLDKVSRDIRKLGSVVTNAGAQILKIGAAGVTGVLGAAAAFAQVGDALGDMSQRTGIAVEQLSAMKFVLGQTDGTMEEFETAIKKMQQVLAGVVEPSEDLTAALGGLGINLEELKGLDPVEQFLRLSDAIKAIQDPAQRTAASVALFSKSGTKMLPVLLEGRKGIEALMQQASALGVVMSSEDAEAADKLHKALTAVLDVTKMLVVNIGGALAPLLTNLAKQTAEVVGWVSNWIKANRGAVVAVAAVAAGLVGLGSTLISVGIGVTLLGVAAGGLSVALAAVGATLAVLLSPITLVVGGVLALGAGLLYVSGVGAKVVTWLSDRFRSLLGVASQTLGGIADALSSGDIALAAKIAWAGVIAAWHVGTEAVMDLLADLTDQWKQGLNAWKALAGLAVAGIEEYFGISFSGILKSATAVVSSLISLFAVVLPSSVTGGFDGLIKGVTATLSALKGIAGNTLDNVIAGFSATASGVLNSGALGQKITDAKRALDEALAGPTGPASQRGQDPATRAALDDLASLSAEARAKARRLNPFLPEGLQTSPDLVGTFKDIAKGPTTSGTFNARALQSLRGSKADRTALAAEKIQKDTKRIYDKMAAVFAFT